MGEEIPIEHPTIEYGNDCIQCYAAGETPKFIYVKFSGVILCPGKAWPGGVDLNTTWTLTQIAGCDWRYLDANWQIDWRNFPAGPWTNCYAYIAGTAQKHFTARQAPICLTTIDNDYLNCPGNPWGLSHSGKADMTIYD